MTGVKKIGAVFVFIFVIGINLFGQTSRVDTKRDQILSYITKLSEGPFSGVISGQNCYHGVEITDSFPLQGYKNLVEKLFSKTGKWVGILGLDYEYSRLFTPAELSKANKVLIDYSKRGGLITINLTPHNPWVNDESDLKRKPGTWNGPGNVLDKSGVTSLNDLIDPTKKVNTAWKRKLDRIADALIELKNAGVIVLWRPLQEMNGNWFWWGMSSHPNDSSAYINLYRHMHDYFTNTKHLNNLIWVYSPNSSQGEKNDSSTWNRTVDWAYPGDKYVDIIAGTSYSDDLSLDDYNTYTKMGKPLGIAEYGPFLGTGGKYASTGSLDTLQIINRIKKDYPRIAYWVSWHQYPGQIWSIIGNRNSEELMKNPGVITLENFPWVQTPNTLTP